MALDSTLVHITTQSRTKKASRGDNVLARNKNTLSAADILGQEEVTCQDSRRFAIAIDARRNVENVIIFEWRLGYTD